jgi:hypothetical protein
MHPHPTLSEAVAKAALASLGHALHIQRARDAPAHDAEAGSGHAPEPASVLARHRSGRWTIQTRKRDAGPRPHPPLSSRTSTHLIRLLSCRVYGDGMPRPDKRALLFRQTEQENGRAVLAHYDP